MATDSDVQLGAGLEAQLEHWRILGRPDAAELIIRARRADAPRIALAPASPGGVRAAARLMGKTLGVSVQYALLRADRSTIELAVSDKDNSTMAQIAWALFLWVAARHPREFPWDGLGLDDDTTTFARALERTLSHVPQPSSVGEPDSIMSASRTEPPMAPVGQAPPSVPVQLGAAHSVSVRQSSPPSRARIRPVLVAQKPVLAESPRPRRG